MTQITLKRKLNNSKKNTKKRKINKTYKQKGGVDTEDLNCEESHPLSIPATTTTSSSPNLSYIYTANTQNNSIVVNNTGNYILGNNIECTNSKIVINQKKDDFQINNGPSKTIKETDVTKNKEAITEAVFIEDGDNQKKNKNK